MSPRIGHRDDDVAGLILVLQLFDVFLEVVAADDERGAECHPRGFRHFVLVDDVTQLVNLLGVSLKARADQGGLERGDLLALLCPLGTPRSSAPG